MSRYLSSPEPALHRDVDAAHHKAIAFKHKEYHRRINAKQARSIAVVIMLVIFAVVLVVLVSKAIELFRP